MGIEISKHWRLLLVVHCTVRDTLGACMWSGGDCLCHRGGSNLLILVIGKASIQAGQSDKLDPHCKNLDPFSKPHRNV